MQGTTGRTVTLPWGRATVMEEVTVDGSAEGERRFEVGLQRLVERGDEGEELLRFFYRVDGRMVRGPLTLRPAEVDELARLIAATPDLARLLQRLAGVETGAAE
jgi:hypothetical protein